MDTMKIYFATHNQGKVREFKQILSGVAEVEQINDERFFENLVKGCGMKPHGLTGKVYS
jgi:inosine/xanthosine triphosphate pyrophosphatase family protein